MTGETTMNAGDKMIHARSLAGIVVLSILLVSGCDKEDNPLDPGGDDAEVLMPFAVGNQWSYTDSIFSATGAFLARDSSRLGVTGKMSIQSEGASVEVYYWNWTNVRTGVAEDRKWLTRNGPDGRYQYGGHSSKGTFVLGKFLTEKFPVSVGETWQQTQVIARTDSTFAIGDTVQMRCDAIDRDFNTPVRAFKCVVYYFHQTVTTSTGPSFRETWISYAPNIGYVGLVSHQNGVRVFKKTLSSYRLN